MNDLHMTTLANDHRNDLMTEARHARLARSTREPVAPTPRRRRSLLQPAAGLLVGRVVLF